MYTKGVIGLDRCLLARLLFTAMAMAMAMAMLSFGERNCLVSEHTEYDVVVILMRPNPTPSENHDGLCLRKQLYDAFCARLAILRQF